MATHNLAFYPLDFRNSNPDVDLRCRDGKLYSFPIFNMFLLCDNPFGRVSRTQNKLNEGLKSLNTYAGLIEQLEKSEFSSSLLQNIRTDLHTEGIPVSSRIKQLGKYLRNLDQRYNAIGFAILNGFFLWDFKQLAAIEKWIRNNGKFLPGWIETIARFDALCSLATFGSIILNIYFPY